MIPIQIDTKEHIVFFTGGNPEVHRILLSCGRKEEEILCDISRAFRVCCILADVVLQSSSNYYESDITRRLVRMYLPLFHRGIAVFVIREDRGDFYSDREAACGVYPQTHDFRGYFGSEGDSRLRELKDLGFKCLRSGRMAGTIDALWASGLSQELQDEDISRQIQKAGVLEIVQRDKLIQFLDVLPKRRDESAFVWDFVQSAMVEEGITIPTGLSQQLRFYLLRTYFRAASALHNSASIIETPTRNLGDVIKGQDRVSKYNPDLFLSFCDTLSIRSIIEQLSPDEIIQLKEMLEFVPFRSAYFDIIDEAKSIEAAKVALLEELGKEQQRLFRQRSLDRLMNIVRTATGIPRLSVQEGLPARGSMLVAALVQPFRTPFVLLREAILSKYREQLDQLAEQYSQGQSSPSIVVYSGKAKVDMMRDKYEAGQAGAMGPKSHAHDMAFNQIWQQEADGIDLQALALQLATLRETLQPKASAPTEYTELSQLAQAEQEAKAGNGPMALEALSKVSKWSLGVAEKVGIGVAVAAIKAACGL